VGPVQVTAVRRTLADCLAAGVAPDPVRARHLGEGTVKVKTYDSPAAFKRALEDRLTGTGSPKAASLVYIPRTPYLRKRGY